MPRSVDVFSFLRIIHNLSFRAIRKVLPRYAAKRRSDIIKSARWFIQHRDAALLQIDIGGLNRINPPPQFSTPRAMVATYK